jgi:hypothetical protein
VIQILIEPTCEVTRHYVRNYIRFLTSMGPISYNYSQCIARHLLINMPVRLLVVSTARWAHNCPPSLHKQIILHKRPKFNVCLLNKELRCSTQTGAVRFERSSGIMSTISRRTVTILVVHCRMQGPWTCIRGIVEILAVYFKTCHSTSLEGLKNMRAWNRIAHQLQ